MNSHSNKTRIEAENNYCKQVSILNSSVLNKDRNTIDVS